MNSTDTAGGPKGGKAIMARTTVPNAPIMKLPNSDIWKTSLKSGCLAETHLMTHLTNPLVESGSKRITG